MKVLWHRRRGPAAGLSPKPFIVASRAVPSLRRALARGTAPILLEGTHCCAYLDDPALRHREHWVRVHNREAEYYAELAARPAPLHKRLYYAEEARRLRAYEGRVLAKADLLLPASPQDEAWCERINPGAVFGHRSYTSIATVVSRQGRGDYALFHAALHIEDNAAAARTLAERVAGVEGLTLVVAGRQPPAALVAYLATLPHVRLVASPSTREMHDLIAGAQVLLLHSEHAAGYKIKLVESLAIGRHVLANPAIVAGAGGLAAATAVEADPAGWTARLRALWSQPFTPADVAARQKLLGPYLSPALGRAFCEKLRE